MSAVPTFAPSMAASAGTRDTRPPAANADSISGDPSSVYKARHPIFEAVKSSLAQGGTESGNAAVHVKGIMESQAQPNARYEPGNPLANQDGYVYSPNVNVVEEMVDMISASLFPLTCQSQFFGPTSEQRTFNFLIAVRFVLRDCHVYPPAVMLFPIS